MTAFVTWRPTSSNWPEKHGSEDHGIEPAFQLLGGSPAIWLEPAAGMPATRVASSPEPALHWDTARRGAGPPCIYRNSHAHKKGAHLSLIRPFHQKPLRGFRRLVSAINCRRTGSRPHVP